MISISHLVSRLGAFCTSTGAGMELQAIGAVIGGAPINGGSGKMSAHFWWYVTGVIFNSLNLLASLIFRISLWGTDTSVHRNQFHASAGESLTFRKEKTT